MQPVSVLFLAGPQHQRANGFAWVLALVQNQLHLLGDGHFDAVLAGEAERGACGEHAFGYFTAERFQNLRQFAALAERRADCPVAAKASRCR